MSHSDAFALKNSGLNSFLLAEVGTELNGSCLTMLSVLARLGLDPWAEAARLATLPKTASIDRLTDSISQMPLCPQALIEARTIAARLILLLPAQVQFPLNDHAAAVAAAEVMPKWLPIVVIAGIAFGAGLSLNRLVPPPTAVAAPTEQQQHKAG